MEVYVKPTNADAVSCPYIKGNEFRQRYTILNDINPEEFNFLILNGWRHFGSFFFMPNCLSCNECKPIRTKVDEFSLSKSQRRNFKKNERIINVEFSELLYTDEIYNIYKKHSDVKFHQETSIKDFKESFFSNVLQGQSKLSLFRYEGKLVGVGFIDIFKDGISSVYFCYDTDFSYLGLGVYSVLKEIEYSKLLGKKYYYLGYFVDGNSSMEYKSKYTPSEILDWDQAKWIDFK